MTSVQRQAIVLNIMMCHFKNTWTYKESKNWIYYNNFHKERNWSEKAKGRFCDLSILQLH